jgi:hypothetical protein
MVDIVEAEVERDGKTTTSRRYCLSSARLDAATFARPVRAHWGIENRLHQILDVVLHDDLGRLRTGQGPEKMAVVKHMALNLVRQAKPTTSLKNRRKLAGWNPDYLETLIHQTARNVQAIPLPHHAAKIPRPVMVFPGRFLVAVRGDVESGRAFVHLDPRGRRWL